MTIWILHNNSQAKVHSLQEQQPVPIPNRLQHTIDGKVWHLYNFGPIKPVAHSTLFWRIRFWYDMSDIAFANAIRIRL